MRSITTIEGQMVKSYAEIYHILDDVRDFLDNYSDVEDGDFDYGPVPNKAMRLMVDVEECQRSLARMAKLDLSLV
jgi:hypothetical protein